MPDLSLIFRFSARVQSGYWAVAVVRRGPQRKAFCVLRGFNATIVTRFRLVVTICLPCRNNLKRKTQKKLEPGEILHNFAVSEGQKNKN